MDVFGPVPSRRLGQSLGINHIPAKTCPYSCIYCQLGRTDRHSVTRQVFADGSPSTDVTCCVESVKAD